MAGQAHFSVRMDRQLHDKFQSAAAYEGRSMSGQILHLINQYLKQFEQEHGPIEPLERKR